jgi:hypothetical protein
MRGGAILIVLLASALAGCVGGGGGGNPNLLAPKLVVAPRADGNVTLFLHGAFREQSYDWMSISVDNATIANRSRVFSSELDVARSGFFVDVQAQTGTLRYESRARIDVDLPEERVRVSFLQDDEWGDARVFGLPYEHVLDRPKVVS